LSLLTFDPDFIWGPLLYSCYILQIIFNTCIMINITFLFNKLILTTLMYLLYLIPKLHDMQFTTYKEFIRMVQGWLRLSFLPKDVNTRIVITLCGGWLMHCSHLLTDNCLWMQQLMCNIRKACFVLLLDNWSAKKRLWQWWQIIVLDYNVVPTHQISQQLQLEITKYWLGST
jgi:hypothetical protein